jgi:hypothetical protein
MFCRKYAILVILNEAQPLALSVVERGSEESLILF